MRSKILLTAATLAAVTGVFIQSAESLTYDGDQGDTGAMCFCGGAGGDSLRYSGIDSIYTPLPF
ncbi:hypothetical protein H4W26_000955 [Nesterenkonia halotolerans]|uniref:Uncharacterized protein n=1 Tax=Nesterenkonia halotolerans TaxID=225325 RepID=A0ABR9J5C9_9MICC|nr:hypothetical protein [Nesterenkonia halotolerans]